MTQTSAATTNEVGNAFVTRRSHKKSRLGCVNCKQRRIKCDEAKPACSNCLRRRKQCDFLHGASLVDNRNGIANVSNRGRSVNSSPGAVGEVGNGLTVSYTSSPQALLTPEDSFEQQSAESGCRIAGAHLNIEDLELLHHFLTRTCHEFAVDDKESSEIWQNKFPQIGFAHHYAMHMILALSALHLGRYDPQRLERCQEQADAHYSMALPTVIDLLQRLDADNCEPLFVTSILICFFHFAKGPKPGQFIAFSDQGECEWFSLLRGVRSINEGMSQIKPTSEGEQLGSQSKEATPLKIGREMEFQPHLDILKARITDLLAGNTNDLQINLTALAELEQIFVARYTDSKQSSLQQQVFAWLYRVAGSYVAGLESKGVANLAIFAHWAALLRDIECDWLFEGWLTHVLRGVTMWMPAEFQSLIAWPLRVAGMEPD